MAEPGCRLSSQNSRAERCRAEGNVGSPGPIVKSFYGVDRDWRKGYFPVWIFAGNKGTFIRKLVCCALTEAAFRPSGSGQWAPGLGIAQEHQLS